MMINNIMGLKSNREYIERIVEVINNDYRRVFKRAFKKEHLVDYCVLFTIRVTDVETKKIRKLVNQVLEQLSLRGYISVKGDRIRINKRIESIEEIVDCVDKTEIAKAQETKLIEESVDKKPRKKLFEGTFISMTELYAFDYKEFARTLKEAGILPPSYSQTPASVKVSIDKDNLPVVGILYKSTTSPSHRTFIITSEAVQEYVNGSKVEKSKRAEKIFEEWEKFKFKSLRNQEKQQRKEIKEITEEAKKILKIENLQYSEKRFIREYGACRFKDFAWECEAPDFITINEDHYLLPITPKTLEMCTLNLMGYAKDKEARNIEYFKEKCRKVAESSPYRTCDWEKTIENLSKYLLQYSSAKLEEENEI